MKIKIDINKLTDSPYSEKTKKLFTFDDTNKINQTVSELKNAHPASFLISGYRGVGKTSFINRVKENFPNSLFVQINLSTYNGYSILLKKIIRQLYLNFENYKNTDHYKKIEEREKLKKLEKNLGLIYDKTFNDIVSQEKDFTLKQNKKAITAKFNLKKLISTSLFLILTILNLIFDFTQYNFFNVSLFIIAFLMSILTNFDFINSKSINKTLNKETLRRSLYDDEIAEYHLFNLLDTLKTLGIPIFIVLDELDKISTIDIIENVINDFKPLMLSENANCFIVAGQNLYYKIEQSHHSDDNIISSLFAKTIHIPFTSYTTLKTNCLNLIIDKNLHNNNLVNSYFDTVILKSFRIPRKLANLIRNDIIWKRILLIS